MFKKYINTVKLENIDINILKNTDIKELADMYENPKVCQYLCFAPAPREVYTEYFEPIAKQLEMDMRDNKISDNIIFVIRNNKTKELIGKFGIMKVSMTTGVFEIGYQLIEKYWKQGIGTKVCNIAVKIAFEELGAHRIEANLYETNIGSKKILEKNGFTYEGISKNYYKVNDKFVGKMNFGLTRK